MLRYSAMIPASKAAAVVRLERLVAREQMRGVEAGDERDLRALGKKTNGSAAASPTLPAPPVMIETLPSSRPTFASMLPILRPTR